MNSFNDTILPASYKRKNKTELRALLAASGAPPAPARASKVELLQALLRQMESDLKANPHTGPAQKQTEVITIDSSDEDDEGDAVMAQAPRERRPTAKRKRSSGSEGASSSSSTGSSSSAAAAAAAVSTPPAAPSDSKRRKAKTAPSSNNPGGGPLEWSQRKQQQLEAAEIKYRKAKTELEAKVEEWGSIDRKDKTKLILMNHELSHAMGEASDCNKVLALLQEIVITEQEKEILAMAERHRNARNGARGARRRQRRSRGAQEEQSGGPSAVTSDVPEPTSQPASSSASGLTKPPKANSSAAALSYRLATS